jgi:hypothetical protein
MCQLRLTHDTRQWRWWRQYTSPSVNGSMPSFSLDMDMTGNEWNCKPVLVWGTFSYWSHFLLSFFESFQYICDEPDCYCSSFACFSWLTFCRLLLKKEVMCLRLKVTNKDSLIIGKNAEMHCSMFISKFLWR